MKKILILSLVTLSIFQFSCKKDDDATPVTQDTNTGLLKDGSKASGTINTTDLNGATQNFSFSHEYNVTTTIYDLNNNEIEIHLVKSFASNYYNYTEGYFYFNAADSVHSMPTSYNLYLATTNQTPTGTFVWRYDNIITQSNSTISNYTLNGNTISFTLTTSPGYTGDNGNVASVVLNLTIPYSNAIYRKASN